MELEPLKQIYSLLSEKAKETAPGKLLEARIADLEKVGIAATAPDFTLTTPEGKQVSLYSVKGKLKIIDFWASWCGPCRMENPNMVKLYNDFKDKGLAIVSVSLDERKVPWVQAIKKDAVDACLFAERMEVRSSETIQHRCRAVDYRTGRKQPHFSQEHQS